MSSHTTVSSDDVITTYQTMLSDAHHTIAILRAQVLRMERLFSESVSQVPEGNAVPSDGSGMEPVSVPDSVPGPGSEVIPSRKPFRK